jgi:beta-lactam-binding protein with PASTA domain
MAQRTDDKTLQGVSMKHRRSNRLGRGLCVLWWALATTWVSLASAQAANVATPVRPGAAAVAQRTVPSVTGLDLAQALSRLQQAGFDSEAISGDSSTDGRRQVTSTDPPAGARFPVVALPKVKVYHRRLPGDDVQPAQRMPSLLDETCADARQRLASLHRTLASCDVGSATGKVAAGRINRQDPRPETVLAAGMQPRAWTEPETTKVPQVRGLRIKDAVQRIAAANLRADFNSQQRDNWHWVDDQNPAADTPVAPGSSVRLTLVARFVVPNLTGLTCAAARGRVTDAGLSTLSCAIERGTGNSLPPDRIHRPDPAPGTVLSLARSVAAWVQPVLVPVPDVVGVAEDVANNRLKERQLRPQPSGPPASTGRRVMTQLPTGGTLVEPNSQVRINLQLTVPEIKGLDCNAAKARALDHGLPETSCQLRRAGTSDPINRVFEQSPAAQTLLPTAQKLVAVIAEPVVVPDVVGRALPAALATLQKSQLQGSPDGSDGDREVRLQEPPRDSLVAPGSTVKLTTNSFALVPEVTGLALAEAHERIRGARFVPSDDVTTGSIADRRVREQSPKAGTRSMVGTRVELVTYREVLVPEVRQLRLPEAESRLRQAGLVAKPDRYDSAPQREVRRQAPAAGARVPENSEVALQTVRLVAVPNVIELSYSNARTVVSDAGLQLGDCEVKTRGLPRFLLGTVTVVSQTPSAGGRLVDEGSPVRCTGDPSFVPLKVATVSTLILCAGALLWWRPVPAAVVGWRVAPDRWPLVTLRLAPDDDAQTADASATPTIVWRRIAGEPRLTLRGPEAIEKERHDRRS